MNRLLTIFTSSLFIVAGCSFGDPIAQRVVVLNFPVSEQETNKLLSATNTEVQDALHIIDDVFAAKKFLRDKSPPGPQDQAQGIIATYGPYTVSINGHKLTVNFVEFGKRHSSPIVKQTSSLMKDKLGSRFGDQRVSIDSNTYEMKVR